jgi:transposase
MSTPRPAYPSDVSDEEWAFVAPYLRLLTPDAPQRKHDPREVFDAVCWLIHTGAQWRYLPHDFPPWAAVHQQAQRWIAAGCFEALVHDLRALRRVAEGRTADPTAVILDGRTIPSTPESGHRAGYNGDKKTTGTTVHAAVDTPGDLTALTAMPANVQERTQVGPLAEQVQAVTAGNVERAWVDQGYTGEDAFEAAAAEGIELVVVKLPEAKKGFVLLPRRWVVERSFAWVSRFRRLARDYERLPKTLIGFHFLAFACLMLHRSAGSLPAGP